MTVEEGHVLNIDGVAGSTGNGTSGGAGSTANKYKPSAGTSATDRAMSGVGQRPSVFQTQGKDDTSLHFLNHFNIFIKIFDTSNESFIFLNFQSHMPHPEPYPILKTETLTKKQMGFRCSVVSLMGPKQLLS